MDAGCADELVHRSSGIRNRIINLHQGIEAARADFDSLAAGSRRVALTDAVSELKAMIPLLTNAVDAACSARQVMPAYELQHELGLAQRCVNDPASFITQPINSETPAPHQVFTPLRVNRTVKRVALAHSPARSRDHPHSFQPSVSTPTNLPRRDLNLHSSPETKES